MAICGLARPVLAVLLVSRHTAPVDESACDAKSDEVRYASVELTVPPLRTGGPSSQVVAPYSRPAALWHLPRRQKKYVFSVFDTLPLGRRRRPKRRNSETEFK